MLGAAQYAAIVIGAFYVFAGFVVLRAMLLDSVMDRLLAALNDPSAPKERMKSRVLTVGAVLTLGGGVALALLSPLAAPFFAANAVWQGGYLLWAERALPPEDESDARGRQQTKNAFVVYLAATAFVFWLAWLGLLRPWAAGLQAHAIDAALIAGAIGLAFAVLHWPRRRAEAEDVAPEPVDAPDVSEAGEVRIPTRLRLAPAYGCSPLWDVETSEPYDFTMLGLSWELVARIDAWDDTWQATYDADDPAASGFKDDAARQAYLAEAREIVAALRVEWTGDLDVREDLR